MTEHQRQRVESLFHAVLALPEHEREQFLASACADDPIVCGEVLFLCSNYAQGKKCLAGITFSDLGIPEEEISALQQGSSLGRYSIVALLGRGGMGEVYLAEDRDLRRKVAIKVLPSSFADNPELIDRLRKEARAASALNHPNILTIYEFGEEGGRHYIVSELVEGASLREQIGRLTETDALSYARQIGQALATAHAAGIVHRDIKPENIMIRKDGYIKVLDFGLAKLTGIPTDSTEQLSNSPRNPQATHPGALMGTINYMSPEQARRAAVDQRTDIWGWGVVLYEMLAGRRPYEASHINELQAVQAQPRIAASGNKQINRVLDKALESDISCRYQEMEGALRDLPKPDTTRRYFQKVIRAFARTEDNRIPFRPWAMLILLLILLGLGTWQGAHQILRPNYRITSTVPMTTAGNATCDAVSPDGAYIAYAAQEPEGQALWLIETRTNASIELIPPEKTEYKGITISKNGTIYFVTRQNEFGTLFKIPLHGGPKMQITADVDSPLALSGDETKVAFLRTVPKSFTQSVITRNLTSGPDKTIMTVHSPDYLSDSLIWTPDGRGIICAGMFHDALSSAPRYKVEEIEVDSGKVVRSIQKPWRWIGMPAWLRRGTTFAAAVAEIGSNRAQLVQVDWPSGIDSHVTQDSAEYRDVSSTTDAKNLITLLAERQSWLWIGPLTEPAKLRSLGKSGRFFGVWWMSSHQVISQTEINNRAGLWLIDVSSNKQQLLVGEPHEYQDAVVSPDGKYLVYSSDRDGTLHLWRADRDGRHAVRLTNAAAREVSPTFTPDSQWVIYASYYGGFSIWKVSINGGQPVRLVGQQAEKPALSPDGTIVACEYLMDDLTWKAVVLDSATGRILHIFPNIPTGNSALPVRWTTDGRQLLYVAVDDNQVSNLWAQPVDGGNPREITHFTDDSIFAFALSPDGESVALVRGKETSDVVRLTVN